MAVRPVIRGFGAKVDFLLGLHRTARIEGLTLPEGFPHFQIGKDLRAALGETRGKPVSESAFSNWKRDDTALGWAVHLIADWYGFGVQRTDYDDYSGFIQVFPSWWVPRSHKDQPDSADNFKEAYLVAIGWKGSGADNTIALNFKELPASSPFAGGSISIPMPVGSPLKGTSATPLAKGAILSLRHKEIFREVDQPWCPEMVVIDPAKKNFLMGAPEDEEGSRGSERPLFRVIIAKKFALGRYTITFEEYDAYCDAVGNQLPDDEGWGRGRRPVINVSWNDAQKYLGWLNGQFGLERTNYRLPSEAEWEFACKAGTTTPFWTGGSISPKYANYQDGYTYGVGHQRKCIERTVCVDEMAGAFNPWGLAHMHGNVWEWCADAWYHGKEFDYLPVDGRAWDSDDEWRLLRGGSWENSSTVLRATSRVGNNSGVRCLNTGFRVARTLD